MTPTRELAYQIHEQCELLAKRTHLKIGVVTGGINYGTHKEIFEKNNDILIATPGRLMEYLETENFHAEHVEMLIIDEADRMLDMGFLEDITKIIDKTPASRQTLLFSATYPDGIKGISGSVQRDPIEIRVEDSHHSPDIEQVFFKVGKSERIQTLFNLLAHYQPESTLIFCNTKQQCHDLSGELRELDLHALALHGDLEQFERDQVLAQFSGKSSSILIATDVAARGLDVKELAAVINFELSRDPEVHIHRIGRTARAGSKGLAVSLFTGSDKRHLQAIEEYQGSAAKIVGTATLTVPTNFKLYPPMVTLFVNGGRKEKVRAGDLLGALTASGEITGAQIGKITLFDKIAYVAVEQQVAKLALTILADGKIKGRKFRVRRLR